jgi:hypothetical protein
MSTGATLNGTEGAGGDSIGVVFSSNSVSSCAVESERFFTFSFPPMSSIDLDEKEAIEGIGDAAVTTAGLAARTAFSMATATAAFTCCC